MVPDCAKLTLQAKEHTLLPSALTSLSPTFFILWLKIWHEEWVERLEGEKATLRVAIELWPNSWVLIYKGVSVYKQMGVSKLTMPCSTSRCHCQCGWDADHSLEMRIPSEEQVQGQKSRRVWFFWSLPAAVEICLLAGRHQLITVCSETFLFEVQVSWNLISKTQREFYQDEYFASLPSH